MYNDDDDKTIQIIPAPGWFIYYDRGQPTETRQAVAAWALDSNGWVEALGSDGSRYGAPMTDFKPGWTIAHADDTTDRTPDQ